jgi:hypothetical protein
MPNPIDDLVKADAKVQPLEDPRPPRIIPQLTVTGVIIVTSARKSPT